MKFKIFSITVILFLILITAKTMYCQEKKCFKLEITSVLKGGKWDGIKNYEYIGSFESQEECQAKKGEVIRRISAKEGMFGGNWILDEVSGDCEPCYKNTEKNGFTQRNTSLEKDYIDKFADRNLMNWYIKNVINPINAGNIVKLLGVYAASLPLHAIGTAIGAYGIARAYIKMFEQSSEAALKRAMELLNIAWEDRNKFLSASGGYLLSAPDEYVTWEDPYLANNAFLKAAEATYIKATEDDVYVTSALLGVIGLIAAETGNKEIATIFLTEAVELLAEVSDIPRRSQLASLMQNTNTSFSLKMQPLNDPNLFRQTIKEPAIKNISGEYECISSTAKNGCMKPGTYTRQLESVQFTETISPLIVTHIDNDLILKSNYLMHNPGGSNVYGSWTSSQQSIISKGKGRIVGNIAEIEWISISENSGYSLTSFSVTTNIPASKYSNSYRSRLRILPNGDIEITHNNLGTTNMAVYRCIK